MSKSTLESLNAAGAWAGDLVWWNLCLAQAPRSLLRDAFAAGGFGPEIVPDLTPERALTRAAEETNKGKLKVARVKHRDGTPEAFAVMVPLQETGERVRYITGARVRIETTPAGTPAFVVRAPADGGEIPEARKVGEDIAVRANLLLTEATTEDFSSAFVRAIRALGAVGLRDAGGVYFLSARRATKAGAWETVDNAARFRAVVEAFAALGIPGATPVFAEMRDSNAGFSGIGTAAKSAFETEIADLVQELEAAKTDGLRADGLAARIDRCEGLFARVGLVSSVLLDAAGGLQARVDAVRAGFGALLAGKPDGSLAKAKVAPVAPAADAAPSAEVPAGEPPAPAPAPSPKAVRKAAPQAPTAPDPLLAGLPSFLQ